jgi:hypothetical protein
MTGRPVVVVGEGEVPGHAVGGGATGAQGLRQGPVDGTVRLARDAGDHGLGIRAQLRHTVPGESGALEMLQRLHNVPAGFPGDGHHDLARQGVRQDSPRQAEADLQDPPSPAVEGVDA